MLFLENYILEICLYIFGVIILIYLIYRDSKSKYAVFLAMSLTGLATTTFVGMIMMSNSYVFENEYSSKDLPVFSPNEKETNDINSLLEKRFGGSNLFSQRFLAGKKNPYFYCRIGTIFFEKDVVKREGELKQCLLEYQKGYLPNLLKVVNSELAYIDKNDSSSMVLVEFPDKRWTGKNLFDLILKKDDNYFHCYAKGSRISCNQLIIRDESVKRNVQKLLDLKKG